MWICVREYPWKSTMQPWLTPGSPRGMLSLRVILGYTKKAVFYGPVLAGPVAWASWVLFDLG